MAFRPASGFGAFGLAGTGLVRAGKTPATPEGGGGPPERSDALATPEEGGGPPGRSGTGMPTPILARILPPSTRPSGTLMAGSPFLRSVASKALPKLPGVLASARVPTHIA